VVRSCKALCKLAAAAFSLGITGVAGSLGITGVAGSLGITGVAGITGVVAITGVVGLVALAPAGVAQAQTAPAVREITRIAGEVYRFRNNFHYSVFAVTPDGIIVTDPINADAAQWLKDELQKRFAKPVRYLVYSHDHADHIAGGQVFADTAIVIAHANAKPVIIGEKRPTAIPQLTFTDEMTIELGGTILELRHVGRNHSDNSIVMRFPKERLLFAVDFIPVNSVAFRNFPDAYLDDWITSLERVEAMDFDVLVPGHGPLGDKTHVTAFRNYMQALRAEVLKLSREGVPLESQMQAIQLPRYQGFTGYQESLRLNIEGMHRLVNQNRRGN
jgi:glyoxylase-like metal-dependent hydrolase (beta-lactamase superfamily II)